MADTQRRMELIRRFRGNGPRLQANGTIDIWVKRLKAGTCPLCGNKIDENEFRDEISRKEYELSHLCQKCQDQTFSARED